MTRSIRHAASFAALITITALAGCQATPSIPRLGAGANFLGLGYLISSDVESRASGVSADGSVVVGTSASAAHREAFRWTPTSGMVGLGYLPNFTYSGALGVSMDGTTVVGESGIANEGQTAFRWTTATRTMEFLASGGEPFTPEFALATSANGTAVVGTGLSDNGNQGFLWTTAARYVGVGFLPGADSSAAQGVSADDRIVVGFSGGPNMPSIAFRWDASTRQMTALKPLAPTGMSNARAVSSEGFVAVGSSTNASGRTEATGWGESGNPVALGFIQSGGIESFAMDAAAYGLTIVGYSRSSTRQEAFIWTPLHGMRSLREVLVSAGLGTKLQGWTLLSADAVNEDGRVIVGWGTNPQGNEEAFIATLP